MSSSSSRSGSIRPSTRAGPIRRRWSSGWRTAISRTSPARTISRPTARLRGTSRWSGATFAPTAFPGLRPPEARSPTRAMSTAGFARSSSGRLVPPEQQEEWLHMVSLATGDPIDDVSPEDTARLRARARSRRPRGDRDAMVLRGHTLGFRTLYVWFAEEDIRHRPDQFASGRGHGQAHRCGDRPLRCGEGARGAELTPARPGRRVRTVLRRRR